MNSPLDSVSKERMAEEIEKLNDQLDEQDAVIARLETALRAFSLLSWMPDAAPGPSCYMVEPVHEAREALRTAGLLLTGKSPFPSDNNGSVMRFPDGKRAVWLGSRAYGEDHRHLVPAEHLATFDAALSAGKMTAPPPAKSDNPS